MVLSSVVLPQPEGPTIISISPSRASKFTRLSAGTAVAPVPKVFETPRTCTA